jgi:hypothetical protein
VLVHTKEMLIGLFWNGSSPFTWPRLFTVLWLIGAVRVLWWAHGNDRRLVGSLIVFGPFVLVMAVIASSGAWEFQNHRYIAPALPLFAITMASAFAPVSLPEHWPRVWVARGHAALVIGFVVALGYATVVPMRSDIKLYAQNATDLEHQVVTIGTYVHDKLPDAHIMLHDAGAIPYYGDTRVFDMLGLITNHQAEVANHGPGARFEFLEGLPHDRRPTHFAYYQDWMGQTEFFGEVILETPIGTPFSPRRHIGGWRMDLIEATWEHAHTAERPLVPNPGWHVVDRVDIADLDSEKAHDWSAALGSRVINTPGARWSLVHRDVGPYGLAIDGGRTIRGNRETFTVTVEPDRPIRLVFRTGAIAQVPFNEMHDTAQLLHVTMADRRVELAVPAPSDSFVEVPIELPAAKTRDVRVTVEASQPYRVFHWFVLQPD